MILPTKHIRPKNSLIGQGALLLKALDRPMTVSGLWDRIQTMGGVGSYQHFVLALDLLFLLGAVQQRSHLLVRSTQ